jgi:uncharacterized cupredoxin-like copper-binding protein
VRRSAAAIAAIAGLALVASAPGSATGRASTQARSASSPARLLVNAKEWSLMLSRQSLKAGDARIQLFNAGEDAHDLRLRRIGGTHTLTIAETRPGRLTELHMVLRPGKWKLWCSLPGHAKAGMRATLTVRPAVVA